jgi:hypothetical protein
MESLMITNSKTIGNTTASRHIFTHETKQPGWPFSIEEEEEWFLAQTYECYITV